MMTTIFMQQEFLPNDISTNPSDVLGFVGLGLIGAGLVVAAVSLTFHPARKVKLTRKHKLVDALAVIMFFTGFVLFFVQMDNEIDADRDDNATNRENIIRNVEAVYDIEGLELPRSNYITGKDYAIEVTVYQDGLAYPAKLSQNPKTYEPTLSVIVSPDVEAKPIRKK